MLKNLFILGALLSAAGCTAEQAYNTGQAYQRNQCAQMPDKTDYERCVRNADGSYDSYKRQTEPAQSNGR